MFPLTASNQVNASTQPTISGGKFVDSDSDSFLKNTPEKEGGEMDGFVGNQDGFFRDSLGFF